MATEEHFTIKSKNRNALEYILGNKNVQNSKSVITTSIVNQAKNFDHLQSNKNFDKSTITTLENHHDLVNSNWFETISIHEITNKNSNSSMSSSSPRKNYSLFVVCLLILFCSLFNIKPMCFEHKFIL
jgi:hypothetical protein